MFPHPSTFEPIITRHWTELATSAVEKTLRLDTSDPELADAITNLSLKAIQTGLIEKLEQTGLPGSIRDRVAAIIDAVVDAHWRPCVDPDTQGTVDQVLSDVAIHHFDGIWAMLMNNLQRQQMLDEMEESQNGCANGAGNGTGPAGAAAGAEGMAGAESGEGSGSVCGSAGAGGAGSGNWLVRLARALADVQTRHLDHMMSAYGRMADATEAQTEFVPTGDDRQDAAASADNAKQNKAHQADFIRAQAEMTAYSRLFSMSSETTSNVLKSIGEGLTSIARKQ